MVDATSRVLEGLESIIRRVTRRLDYCALYPSVVQSQAADGTLHLVPEDVRFSSIQGVPIRLGIPGATVTVAVGARVLLGFEGGDQNRPVATLWESGTAVSVTFNGSTLRLSRTDDSTTNGKLVFSPGGTFVAYVAPGAPDVPTPPGGSVATLSGVITGTSIIRG